MDMSNRKYYNLLDNHWEILKVTEDDDVDHNRDNNVYLRYVLGCIEETLNDSERPCWWTFNRMLEMTKKESDNGRGNNVSGSTI